MSDEDFNTANEIWKPNDRFFLQCTLPFSLDVIRCQNNFMRNS